MNLQWIFLIVILGTGMLLSVKRRKLTVVASIVGGMMGVLIFAGAGFTGVAMTAAFFLLGTVATSWKLHLKRVWGLAEENKGQRKAGQVWANAGVAAITGFLGWVLPAHRLLFQVMMAGSLAAAAGDTLSSELGNVYGKKFINILTWKKDQRGLNGVISLEGTLAGLAGSALIGIIYAVGFNRFGHLTAIVISGLIGNLFDSMLGATVERRHILSNDAVNFLNTLTGALAAALLMLFN